MMAYTNKWRRAYLRNQAVIEILSTSGAFLITAMLWAYMLIAVLPRAIDAELDHMSAIAETHVSMVGTGDARRGP